MDTQDNKTAPELMKDDPRVIEGNVDNVTGNVDVPGPLIIRGDVVSGFSVRARGTLEVEGSVQDAVVEGDADIIIRQGFTGSGKGKITAVGAVALSYVHNQTVCAGKDVSIATECINATIFAGGRIAAPRAVVAGGRLDAMTEIELGSLGPADNAAAKVRVGHRAKIIEHLSAVEKDVANAERQLREVREAVYKLVKIKVDGGKLSADMEASLAKLQAAQKLLPQRITALRAEQATLQAELQKKSDARIVVHGDVFAETMIEVNSARKILDDAVRSVEFIEWGGALEARAL